MYKVSLIFKYVSGGQVKGGLSLQRSGSWTESWYRDATLDQVISLTDDNAGLAVLRANLLPNTVSIIGWRIQSVDPKGGTQAFHKILPGVSGDKDIPQVALYISIAGAGVQNEKVFLMRGMPDTNVVLGEYFPDANGFRDALKKFITYLGTGWKFKGKSHTPPTFDIATIDNAGLVTTFANHGYVAGNKVRILRGHSLTLAPPLRGVVTVVAAPSATTFTTGRAGPGSTGGTVIADTIVYPTVDPNFTQPVEVVTRKVGRPTDSYVGRRRRRR